MVDLKILEINGIEYKLLDGLTGRIYRLLIEFYGTEANQNDIISVNKKLLDSSWKNFAQPYAFKVIKVAEVDDKNKEDYAILKCDNKNFVLQRLYG